MANSSRSRSGRGARSAYPRKTSRPNSQVSSEEAIKAGEQIAMAAFASGLKLAAAFGTVAAKTAGLALASLASGADKFSELVKEEARRSYTTELDGKKTSISRGTRTRSISKPKKRVS
jgi:hypothetical protein